MRLRSNHVLPPIEAYVPRRRRQTRSASAGGSEPAPEPAPEVAEETVPEAQSAEERPAPRRKPAKRGGRKKKTATKGKKAAAETEAAEAQADSQEGPVALIPSVEQPDTRTLPPKPTVPPKARVPPRMFRGRVITAFRYGSAGDLLQKDYPQSTPSPPQTPVLHYAWPPLSPGQVYNKLPRIPWSLPWAPPSPWRGWPHKPRNSDAPDESLLTPAEEQASRKRSRFSEHDPSPSKRHKLTRQTPPSFENRPRGSSRRTYADRARRREAERDGRIDRTIYRFPQLLAQQGEDARSGNSTPEASHASEETTPRGTRIVPLSSLPSALPQNQDQDQNRPGWRQWIFNSVTGLWRRDNAPQTAETSQVAENQHPMGNESSSSIATPSSAPPSSFVSQRNFESPTPRPRVAESQTSYSRLTASARAPQVGKRRNYSYDLDPAGFDPELLARMRTRSSNPADVHPVTSLEEVRERYDNESKKRKREPSPDVIPHPPGCSYGFDPDYFIYDDDDEDLPTDEQKRQDNMTKQPTVTDEPEEEHVSKRARSDKTHLEDSDHQNDIQPPGIENLPQSTLQPPAVTLPQPILQSSPLTLPRYEPTPQTTDAFSEELRKARQVAEQYKPKTPSRLRAAHRFSSGFESVEAQAARRRKMRKTSLAMACPTGDLNNIIWPETESWIERLDCNHPKLDIMISGERCAGERFDDCERTHRMFMSKLAERRAARQ
ncbi:unnamed protein product [Penicillium glandicola]